MHSLPTWLTSLLIGLGLVAGPASAADHTTFDTAFAVDARIFHGIDVDAQTDSEQRVILMAHFQAPPEVVFARIMEHDKMDEWMPKLERLVEVDHTNSEIPGMTGVGTERTVIFAGDSLTEDITGWEEGRAYSYSVRDTPKSPTINHVGVFTMEDDGAGGTYLTWRQFFEPVNFVGRVLVPRVMTRIMSGALENLAAEFGGELIGDQ